MKTNMNVEQIVVVMVNAIVGVYVFPVMSAPISSIFYFNCTGRKFSSVCVDSKLCRPKWRAGDEESIARQAGSEELHVSAAHTQDALPIWINVIPPHSCCIIFPSLF